jgi:hypothetical protein
LRTQGEEILSELFKANESSKNARESLSGISHLGQSERWTKVSNVRKMYASNSNHLKQREKGVKSPMPKGHYRATCQI